MRQFLAPPDATRGRLLRLSDEIIAPHLRETQSSEQVKEILPLGKGIEDVQLLVLNGAHQLAGVGETGEIYMRSPHVARGYRGDVVLTSEKISHQSVYETGGRSTLQNG